MEKKISFEKLSFTKDSLVIISSKRVQTFKLSDFTFDVNGSDIYLTQVKFSFNYK